MARRRGRTRDLCNGPGRLTQALGVDLAYDGHDLTSGDLKISNGSAARRHRRDHQDRHNARDRAALAIRDRGRQERLRAAEDYRGETLGALVGATLAGAFLERATPAREAREGLALAGATLDAEALAGAAAARRCARAGFLGPRSVAVRSRVAPLAFFASGPVPSVAPGARSGSCFSGNSTPSNCSMGSPFSDLLRVGLPDLCRGDAAGEAV